MFSHLHEYYRETRHNRQSRVVIKELADSKRLDTRCKNQAIDTIFMCT